MILKDFPGASFGFIAARTVDIVSRKVESYDNNQRFRVYKGIIARKIGTLTFEHIEYPEISGYLLVNRTSGDTNETENAIKRMFSLTYDSLPDIM